MKDHPLDKTYKFNKRRATMTSQLDRMLQQAKGRAVASGYPFEITRKDIVIPEKCPVLGTPLNTGHREDAPSIDKVNPQLGYVVGNVAVISMRANRIKSDASLSELEAIVSYIKNT